MRVRLRYFASVREALGRSGEESEVPEGSTVDAVWQSLVARQPRLAALRVQFAVNHEYVDGDSALREDDEVVFIPPVSGGSGGREPKWL